LKVKSNTGKEFKLNDFKGKVTFIRFWKSYEPNVADMTFLIWLEKQYGTKVQFLYICSDGFSEKWEKMFARFPEIKGIQLTMDDDKEKCEEFLDDYAQIALAGKDGALYYQNLYEFEEGLEKLLQ
jgi:hypothetical protein